MRITNFCMKDCCIKDSETSLSSTTGVHASPHRKRRDRNKHHAGVHCLCSVARPLEEA